MLQGLSSDFLFFVNEIKTLGQGDNFPFIEHKGIVMVTAMLHFFLPSEVNIY